MKTWTERVRNKARNIKDHLKMTFEDENNKYIFHFDDIKAHSYGPGCPDFDLFVDIGIIKKVSPVNPVYTRPKYLMNQALGNSLDSKPRESIQFGKEYYDTVYQKLYDITETELRTNNDKLIGLVNKLSRTLKKFL